MDFKYSDINITKIEEKLKVSSNQKLIEALLQLYRSNPDTQKRIEIIFADIDKESAKIARNIRNEIAVLEKSVRSIEYEEINYFAKDLNDLRLRIVNEICGKSTQLAFDLLLEFIDLHTLILNRVSDENWIITEVFITACTDLGKISQNVTHVSLEDIVDILFLKVMRNEYGVYDNIITDFKDTLKEEGFVLLKNKLKQVLDAENKIRIQLALQEIADCQNDVHAFIQACSFDGNINDHDHLKIAERFINNQQGKEASEWLDRAAIASDHPWYEDKVKLKIKAFELEKKYDKAQNERLDWFRKTLKPEMYKEILNNTTSFELQNSFKSEAIEKAFLFKEPHRALNFLIEIEELKEASKFVHLRHAEFNGDRYYILKQAAKMLRASDPIAATRLYRIMIQYILNKGASKYYDYGVTYLIKCKDLDLDISNWENIQKHKDYLADLEWQYKSKRSFWTRYQSALQEKAR